MDVSVWNDLKFIVVLFWHDFGPTVNIFWTVLHSINDDPRNTRYMLWYNIGKLPEGLLHVCPYQTELQYLLNLDVSFFQTTPENKLKSHKTVFWIDGYFLSSIFLFLIINKDSFALYVYIWG